MSDITITFDEKVKGWTSFHSFTPDFMIGMNNDFFTFKNGDLFIHDESNLRNTYYGVKYPSKISLIVNDSPSEIKELQSISLEGSTTWETLIKAYISSTDDYKQSSIHRVEFKKKEGIWYAYARRDESEIQTDSKSLYGIGRVEFINGNEVTIDGWSQSLVVGDVILDSNLNVIGDIQNINDNTLLLSNSTGLSTGDFILGRKNPRVEGGNLRGYSLRLDLENDDSEKVELFTVNTNVIKSYTS